jgi:DNA-binding PadR family transcriptional regulator
MTDFAILGFLMRGPRSGYDVKKLMALSTGNFYEASYGSIYPSLERMARAGLVEAERTKGSGRQRKAYSATAAGRRSFLEWLASPLDIAKGPSQLLLRLFFMGCLEPEEAKRALERFAASAEERRSWLATALDGLVEAPDFFQASTQRFGLAYYAFLASWLAGLGAEVPPRPAGAKAAKAAKEKTR